jgi:hypothetical protein
VCRGCGNPSTYLRRRYRFGEGSGTSFEVSRVPPLQGSGFGKFVLSSLQSGTRSWTKIGRGLSLRADGGSKATPEIPRAAHLFLSSVLRVASHGAGTGRRVKPCRLANDPRHCRSRSRSDRGGMGEPAWHRRRLAPSHRDVRRCSSNARRSLLRVLSGSSIGANAPVSSPEEARNQEERVLLPGWPSSAIALVPASPGRCIRAEMLP